MMSAAAPHLDLGRKYNVATKTKSALLPVLIIVGLLIAFVVVKGKVGNVFDDLFVGGGNQIIGIGDYRIMVSADQKSQIEQCSTQQIIASKECGDIKIVLISAEKMPFIARNISLAWTGGKPAELTRDKRENRRGKYGATCGAGNFTINYPGVGSCDEYPFASTMEGGAGARTEEVPIREQDCQGGTLSTSYRYQNIAVGDKFLVIITYPDKISPGPFRGVDSAEDQSACGS